MIEAIFVLFILPALGYMTIGAILGVWYIRTHQEYFNQRWCEMTKDECLWFNILVWPLFLFVWGVKSVHAFLISLTEPKKENNVSSGTDGAFVRFKTWIERILES